MSMSSLLSLALLASSPVPARPFLPVPSVRRTERLAPRAAVEPVGSIGSDSLSQAALFDADRLVPDDIDFGDDDGWDEEGDGEWGYDDDGDAAAPSSPYEEVEYEDGGYGRDAAVMLTEREDRLHVNAESKERCILVGVEDLSLVRARRFSSEDDDAYTMEESLTELRELASTAGMEVSAVVTQRLQAGPNPKTYIGSGKVRECAELVASLGIGPGGSRRDARRAECCTVVVDAELSPGQQRALENGFNGGSRTDDWMDADRGAIKVVDRTALILDIFAQHARTSEGKLQVDLALHEYRKPRMTRLWTHLERQSGSGGGGSGGVGLRGPGERQLEIDRRLIRDRIIVLKRQIDDIQKQRDLHRRGRDNLGLPVVAIVGYTNAGKSTLLNYLTRAGVMAEDILFATLDPTTRRVKLPGHKTHPEVLLTDTVGFIQRLPTQLVAAFRATLEEVRGADVLVHMVDVSAPSWQKQEAAVADVLRDIGVLDDRPVVRVLNKIDLLPGSEGEDLAMEAAFMDRSVAISAATGEGIQDFVACMEDALQGLLVPVEMLVPYNNGEDLNLIHEVGAVETVEYREDGTYICGRVPAALANRLKAYNVGATEGGGAAAEDDTDWVALGRGRHSVTK